jgi:xylono-1,5-lactonase
MKPKDFLDENFLLGEGIVFDSSKNVIFFTDILSKELWSINLSTKGTKKWKFDQFICWIFPTNLENRYVIGLSNGIAIFNLISGDYRWLEQSFPGEDSLRLNDAFVDKMGRVWYGSMNFKNESLKSGTLVSYSCKDGLKLHDSGFGVLNGPVITSNSEHLYLNDTLDGKIYRYKLDLNSGDLSQKMVFKEFDSHQGYPDGMCFDQEGCLWVAMWGSSSIIRLDSNGNILETINFPAKQISNLCFFGKNLNNLMITSASVGINKTPNWKEGKLFLIEKTNFCGLPPGKFKLEC